MIPLMRDGEPVGVIGLSRAGLTRLRSANRAGDDLRRSGGDRYRERAAVRGASARPSFRKHWNSKRRQQCPQCHKPIDPITAGTRDRPNRDICDAEFALIFPGMANITWPQRTMRRQRSSSTLPQIRSSRRGRSSAVCS